MANINLNAKTGKESFAWSLLCFWYAPCPASDQINMLHHLIGGHRPSHAATSIRLMANKSIGDICSVERCAFTVTERSALKCFIGKWSKSKCGEMHLINDYLLAWGGPLDIWLFMRMPTCCNSCGLAFQLKRIWFHNRIIFFKNGRAGAHLHTVTVYNSPTRNL